MKTIAQRFTSSVRHRPRRPAPGVLAGTTQVSDTFSAIRTKESSSIVCWNHASLATQTLPHHFASPAFRRHLAPSAEADDMQHPWTKEELQKRVAELCDIISNRNHPRRSTLHPESCFHVLQACMQTHSLVFAQKAADLLKTMEKAGGAFKPIRSFYDTVLYAYAISGGGEPAARAATQLLQHMQARNDPAAQPTVKTYNIALHAWAQSRYYRAGFEAHAIVESMTVEPNFRTLVTLVDAWGKSEHFQAATHVWKILGRAVDTARTSDLKLERSLFHAVLGTLAQTPRIAQTFAHKAQELLSVMEECAVMTGNNDLLPNTQTYAMVMKVWRQCEQADGQGTAARKAEKLLFSMVEDYRRNQSIKPNSACFSTCIAAWSRAHDHPEAPERAEGLLNLFADLYEETKDDTFRHHIDLYNGVISAWTRAVDRPDSMDRSWACLQALRRNGVKPDRITFNTILDGLARRGKGQEAKELLRWLESVQGQFPEIAPDHISYNSALKALSSDATLTKPWESALELLEYMEKRADDSQGPVPTVIEYTTALGAWLVTPSISIDDALLAQALVDRVIHSHRERAWKCQPDNHLYGALMRVYGNVDASTGLEKVRVLELLDKAMQDCEALVGANYVAYNACMKAINMLCKDPVIKRATLEKLFEQCCEKGQVSKQVIISMKVGVWKFTGKEPEIQDAWSRRVPLISKPEKPISADNNKT